MRKQLRTHPNNVAILRQTLPELQRKPEGSFDPFTFMPVFNGIDIVTDKLLPERDIEQKWHPPASGSRFYEYGPEDEHWMRPAGLGTIKAIDKGPLFYLIDLSMLTFNFESMPIVTPAYEPRIFFRNTV